MVKILIIAYIIAFIISVLFIMGASSKEMPKQEDYDAKEH